MITLISDTSFTQLISDALRNYQSTLALSRSDLANSPLVTPTLVKDESSPTAEERGHGLRLVLQWAVNLLAPGPTPYPLGQYRPLDDPTWRDPRWWGYNILRHRYLEPLHPDDFVEGGRYTESLLALTGISSSDTFFDERQRAIRTVAERLRQQLVDSQASGELQQLALQEAVQPLAKQAEAMRLLGIAATFDDIFPLRLLLEIAANERIHTPSAPLATLIAQRYLLTGDEGQNLWLSPVLRRYVYELQQKDEARQRHRWIAHYYEGEDDALRAARHWQRAEEDRRAVRVLLPAAQELIHELHVKELVELLQQLDAKRVEAAQWYRVQLLLSDLFQRSGQFEDTLAACRRALQATTDPAAQARVYRRMGKLYESRNQAHALRYYQQAVERFMGDSAGGNAGDSAGDSNAGDSEGNNAAEFAEVLKDRGWLYYYRKEWSNAETDLTHALAVAPPAAKRLQADILDAMASLHREIGARPRGLAYAERALALREQVGDLLAVAKSLGNLGFHYRAMQDYHHAVLAHQEALATYEKLGNRELMAAAWLNIGASYFHAHDLDAAMHAYHQSLEIGRAMRLPLIALKAHYNLAEASAATGQLEHAVRHWHAGHALCEHHGFADQAADFRELAQDLALPVDLVRHEADSHGLAGTKPSTVVPPHAIDVALEVGLTPDEAKIIDLAQREQQITARRLMAVADVSRATATRRLTALVERGLLTLHGQGRGAYYALAAPVLSVPVLSVPVLSAALSPAAALPPVGQLDQWRETLQREQSVLAAKYDLRKVGLLSTSGALLKIVACFATPPDLVRFFTLRQHLTSLLSHEVDLLPDFVLSATPPTHVEWLWQADAI